VVLQGLQVNRVLQVRRVLLETLETLDMLALLDTKVSQDLEVWLVLLEHKGLLERKERKVLPEYLE
jgi:hypothetical protein